MVPAQNSALRVFAPTESQKIRSTTVVLLVLNRTIGSGIFKSPARVLRGTDSVGISLIFWALGAIVRTCGLMVWLEWGLSIPREYVGGRIRPVPRSGGEKNYLEYLMQKPRFLATCMYGIIFIILGNLAGNAIAFGSYIMAAAGRDSNTNKGAVLGIAIAAQTFACGLHVFSRRGGLLVNNAFAIFKVMLLLTLVVFGFWYAAGNRPAVDDPSKLDYSKTTNFNTNESFNSPRTDLASYSNAFLYIMYAYSGVEQPFYVLSEVHRPRRNFARAVFIAMAINAALFMLVNISYLCVVNKSDVQPNDDRDLVIIFIEKVFGQGTNGVAYRIMSAAIAISILGNIVVMTFTASRVKQEIAKEAIIPKSVFWGTSHATPWAMIKDKYITWRESKAAKDPENEHAPLLRERPEETPMAALLLHWLSAVFLIAVTSMLSPDVAWRVLVNLYSYVIRIMFGFFTAFGLLYLKMGDKFKWKHVTWVSHWHPWGGPTAAIIYSLVCGFLLVTAWLPPQPNTPLAEESATIPWYIIPAIGISSLLWGVIWYGGLHFIMWKRGESLVVDHTVLCEKDDADGGEWVTKEDVVHHTWQPIVG